MKRSKLFWGIMFISIGVLLILNLFGITFGLPESIPAWKILIGLMLLATSIDSLINRRIYLVFFPLAFLGILFQKELRMIFSIKSGNFATALTLITISALFTVGFLLVVPKKMKLKPSKMGSHAHYVDCSVVFNETIENNLGACEVFFTNTDHYNGNGTITIDNNMGAIALNVPKDWYVVSAVQNNMGSVNMPRRNETSGFKRLDIKGENNMGAVNIRLVK